MGKVNEQTDTFKHYHTLLATSWLVSTKILFSTVKCNVCSHTTKEELAATARVTGPL